MVEDIDYNLKLQISEPYLLYRNKNGEINGIWFYNQNEREKLTQLIQRTIVESAKYQPSPVSTPPLPTFLYHLTQGQMQGPPNSDLRPRFGEVPVPPSIPFSFPFPTGHYVHGPPNESKGTDAPMSKPQLRSSLLNLVQDERFIDQVYMDYLSRFEHPK